MTIVVLYAVIIKKQLIKLVVVKRLAALASCGNLLSFPGGTIGQEPTFQSKRHKDTGSITGSGRFPAGGPGNPFQYSCLETPMGRRASWAIVHRVSELDMTEVT